MSIWTKPIFQASHTGVPAGKVAVRCARIRSACGIETFRIVSIGSLTGVGVFFAELMVTIGMLRTGATATSGTAFLTGLHMIDLIPAGLAIGMSGVIVWAMPRVIRTKFERRAAGLTYEKLTKQRRLRRRASRTIVWFDAIFGAVACVLLPWQLAAIFAMFIAVKSGVVVISIGIFGRRGTRLVCARCDYPMVTWRGASVRCPECGQDWRKPWGARFGQRAVRWKWLVSGVALIAVSTLLTVLVGMRGFPGP